MIVEETYLKGCFIITPKIFEDDRGYFFESFNEKLFEKEIGQRVTFVQDNQSKSSKGVLRGLHYQTGQFAQAKLVRVIKGSVLDVCVDLRRDSETFGKHYSIVLDDKSQQQLFIPKGFAHGFVVLEDDTLFSYKCDAYYNKASEAGIIFNDNHLNIDWALPEEDLIISEKDKVLPTFKKSLNYHEY
ncbi:dTDP-4-dehydrorhamnose 3,5-epimerase [Aestuariibaculum sediminum]|uniref:dTDP-4-dehydrorhamnose 3,5-epimerase n=1 Tax=Aestuariibaculum sediminum TaxID=2770637 RepID=A0A8J6Q1S6_9FLAO|nr:dTDP-4-dehydrorhamnose 3,5-epimerase [Aestuariibaculum sediminum]MBD0831221.1 dTDP-4-dehydrorhamnose 3,5-epimerase [Aestuariibaculum sediminum]